MNKFNVGDLVKINGDWTIIETTGMGAFCNSPYDVATKTSWVPFDLLELVEPAITEEQKKAWKEFHDDLNERCKENCVEVPKRTACRKCGYHAPWEIYAPPKNCGRCNAKFGEEKGEDMDMASKLNKDMAEWWGQEEYKNMPKFLIAKGWHIDEGEKAKIYSDELTLERISKQLFSVWDCHYDLMNRVRELERKQEGKI